MGRGDSPDIKQFFKKRGRVLNFISTLNPLIDLNIGNNGSIDLSQAPPSYSQFTE
uniref:Uncharacterized protein n=1 Tax=Magallana gigas TaxID=29159 RepID=K1Q2B1_MAGGI